MFLNTITNSVFIILGKKCNFNCKYCIQNEYHENNNKNVKINYNVYNFIKKISSNQKEKIDIVFYGGEPLLYFDIIKEIIKHTIFYNVRFKIISNGSLITKDIVNFINKYNINIAISWDGKNTKNTRFIDIFENKELKNLIFEINNLTINTVLSSENYPLEMCEEIQKLANEYMGFNNHGKIDFHFEELIDNNIQYKDLLNIDFNRINQEIKIIIQNCLDLLVLYFRYHKFEFNEFNYIKFMFIKKYFDLLSDHINNNILEPCYTGIKDLSIDLQGNLYFCQDSNNIIENINNLEIKKYKNRYNYFNKNSIMAQNSCKKCLYYSICLSGCKLIDINIKKQYLCQLKKSIGEPVFNIYNQLRKEKI